MKAANAFKTNIFKTTTEAPARLNHESVFADKRVIPPLYRPIHSQGSRVRGTLHLPGSLRAADTATPE